MLDTSPAAPHSIFHKKITKNRYNARWKLQSTLQASDKQTITIWHVECHNSGDMETKTDNKDSTRQSNKHPVSEILIGYAYSAYVYLLEILHLIYR